MCASTMINHFPYQMSYTFRPANVPDHRRCKANPSLGHQVYVPIPMSTQCIHGNCASHHWMCIPASKWWATESITVSHIILYNIYMYMYIYIYEYVYIYIWMTSCSIAQRINHRFETTNWGVSPRLCTSLNSESNSSWTKKNAIVTKGFLKKRKLNRNQQHMFQSINYRIKKKKWNEMNINEPYLGVS